MIDQIKRFSCYVAEPENQTKEKYIIPSRILSSQVPVWSLCTNVKQT